MDYHQVAKWSEGIATKDGALIRFKAHTMPGEVVGLEMPTKNIGDLIAFLVGLSQFVEQRKEPSQMRPMPGQPAPRPYPGGTALSSTARQR